MLSRPMSKPSTPSPTQIREAGGSAHPVIVDVTDKASVTALYDEAERVFGGVDISIQNAGVITIARIEG